MYKTNEIINKFLLAGDKFMPEMHLRNQDLLIMLVDHLQKIKIELKSLGKVVIRVLFTKMGLIKHVFKMIWPMVNQKN